MKLKLKEIIRAKQPEAIGKMYRKAEATVKAKRSRPCKLKRWDNKQRAWVVA